VDQDLVRIARHLGEGPASELVGYLDARRPGWRAEFGECPDPRRLSPPPQVPGAYFDVAHVDRFLQFCRMLRHVKGSRWARLPLELDVWQIVFFVAPVFGWRRADGFRLVATVWLEVPRKNGKSTLAAAVALYLLAADREPGAEVVLAACDRRQAGAVFQPARMMALRSPMLRKRLHVGKRMVAFEATGSTLEAISGDADRQQGLNTSGAVIDEVHVHKSRDLIDAIESGTGSRGQPLVLLITTAGIDDPGSIYTEKHAYAEAVAAGEVADATTWGVIFAADPADDPFDVETQRKANPGWGRTIRPDYLAGRAEKARASPASLLAYKRLHLGVITGAVSSFIDLDAWDRSGLRLGRPLRELLGREGYAGLDLASTTDLAAFVAVVPDEDDGSHGLRVVVRCWTPEATLERREERDRAPYSRWVKEGYLLTTPGSTIDHDAIEDEVVALADVLNLARIGYDPWQAHALVGRLEKAGLPLWQVRQGFASMSAPTKETERMVLDGLVWHGAHPVLRWAARSMVVAQDAAGNLKPDRNRSTGRIDPVVALVMAIDAFTRAPVEYRSVYESHGLITA